MEQRPIWPVFVAFLLATLTIIVGGTILFLVRYGIEGAQHPPAMDAATLNFSALITELVLVATALLFGRPFGAARFRLVRGRARLVDAIVVAAGTVALADVLDSVATLLSLNHSGTIPAMRHAIESAAGPTLVATVLIVGPLAGFGEELFFRGFMQTRMSERWSPWRAVVLASLCFGLMHFDLVHSTEAFLIGLWLGHAAERTGSLWPSVLGHVVNNTASVAFQSLGLVTSSAWINLAWGAGGLIVLIPCWLLLRRRPLAVQQPVPVIAAQSP